MAHLVDSDVGRYWWISIVGFGIGLPLMFARSLKKMQVTSVIGNIGIIYVAAIAVLIYTNHLPGCDAPTNSTAGGDGPPDFRELSALSFAARNYSQAGGKACGGQGDQAMVINPATNKPTKFVPYGVFPHEAGVKFTDALGVISVCALPPLNSAQARSSLGLTRGVWADVFAYSCTQMLPQIMAEMQNCTLARIDGVIGVSITLCTLIFVIAAASCYMYYGQNVAQDMLTDFPSNIWSTLARCGILLSVIASFPVFMLIVRNSVCKVAFDTAPTTLSLRKYVGVTLAIFSCSYAIAMAVGDHLDTVLGFVGSTVGMLVGFTFPAYIYVRLGPHTVAASGRINGSLNDPLVGAKPARRGCSWLFSVVLFLATLLLIPVLVGVQVWMSFIQQQPE